MRKIFFIISALSICLLVPASALASCEWRSETTTTNPEISTSDTSGGCSGTERQPKTGDAETCTGTMPSGSSSGFSTTRYVCCCAASAASPKLKEAPKFEIPQMQVKIDTVKLTQPKCTANESGSFSCSVAWIGEYITGIYQYAIGIAGILAVIVLMVGGLIYLVSGGDATRITQAKELIIGSITGLVILLSSYFLLSRINPKLAGFGPLNLNYIPAVEVINKYEIQGCSDQWATNKISLPILSPEVINSINAVAKSSNIDPCYFYAIVTQESGGKASAFGDDRQVATCGVYSRRKYICNTYQKCCDDPKCTGEGCLALVQNKALVPKKDINNLDLDYSYGFGLGQITYTGNRKTLCNNDKGFTFAGTCYNFSDLLNAETNLKAVAAGTKESWCPAAVNGTVNQQCFEKYAGSGSWAVCTGSKKMKVYEACQQQGFAVISSKASTLSN